MNQQWCIEWAQIQATKDLKFQLEEATKKLKLSMQISDYECASKLKLVTIPALENKLHNMEKKPESPSTFKRLLNDTVTETDIADVISRKTGIPLQSLLQGEAQRLLHLEDFLKSQLIGQPEATRTIAEAVITCWV